MFCKEKYFINILDLDSWTITVESSPLVKFFDPGMFGVGKDLYMMYESRTPNNDELAWMRDGETGQWKQVEGLNPPRYSEPGYPREATLIPDDFYSC